MGAYVNPRNGQTKEEWLNEKGLPIETDQISRVDSDELRASGLMLVCLIQNTYFTAALIAYSEREKRVAHPATDPRPRKWYLCTIPDLHTVSPELANYLAD